MGAGPHETNEGAGSVRGGLDKAERPLLKEKGVYRMDGTKGIGTDMWFAG